MKIKLEIEPREHYSRYVFGSAIYSEEPNDIDVAIIYDKKYIRTKDAIAYRRELVDRILQLNSIMVDSILLSKEEEREMDFLTNAKCLEF